MIKVKKIHMILLVMAAIIALSSFYSLAAINQVYTIEFDWYSQYYGKFLDSARETSMDSWKLESYPENIHFDIIQNNYQDTYIKGFGYIKGELIDKVDLGRYVLLYCALGKVDSPDYRMKIISIAQRNTVVEVMVSVNSPSGEVEALQKNPAGFFNEDLVRIDKAAFPIRGKLTFVFKNQGGTRLFEKDYYIR